MRRGKNERQRLQDLLIFRIGGSACHVAVLPRAEFVHHENDAVVLPDLCDLVVDVSESLLEFSFKTTLWDSGPNEFLAKLLWSILGSEVLRRTAMLFLKERLYGGLKNGACLVGVPGICDLS